jgi:hypothetical protein
VRSFQDCLKIQSDLNRLVDWCGANSLELNVGKSITFSKLCYPVECPYMLVGITISLICRMSFSRHMDVTVGKAGVCEKIFR